MQLNLHETLSFVQEIALQAGEIIRRERELKQLDFHLKNKKELVTSADLHSEQFLREQIQSIYPDHKFLSEEFDPHLDRIQISNDYLWVIDPIDGTVNYAHNHHFVGISIALVHKGKSLLGVVYCPFLFEMFTAIRGEGAWLNDVPISVSKTKHLKDALISTGFPYERDHVDLLVNRLKKVLTNCQDVRRNGSASIDICWVAMGRVDGFYESLKPWDIAAGFLIAREAGAKVGHLGTVPENASEELFAEDVIVANTCLFDSLKGLLTQD